MGKRQEPPSDKEFYARMATEDALHLVIEGTIIIEMEIKKLFDAALEDADALDSAQLDYSQHIALAIAIGLEPRFLKPLKALGGIRNKFAHRLMPDLSQDDAKAFYDCFASAEKQMMFNIYAKLSKQRMLTSQQANIFGDLGPLEKFVLMIVTIRSAIVAARHEVERRTIRLAGVVG